MSGLIARGGGQGGRKAFGKWRDLPATINTDGLLGVFLLGQSLAASIKNRWGADDATVVGAPTVNAYSLGLAGGVNYLALPFVDPATLTLVAIARTIDSGNSVFVGSSGTANFGANLFAVPSAPTIRMTCFTEAPPVGSNSGVNNRERPLSISSANFKCLIGDANGAEVACADMSGSGAGVGAQRLVAAIASGDQVRRVGTQMAIGGRTGTPQTGASEVMLAMVFARRLSTGEMAALYAKLLAMFGTSGGGLGFSTV